MRFNIFYGCLFCAFIAVAGCGSPPKKETILHQKWQLQGVLKRTAEEAGKDTTLPAQPKQKKPLQIFYEFHPDKTYTFSRGTQVDKGSWAMSSNEKILLLRSPTESSEFKIYKLADNQLILTTEDAKGSQEILYLEGK